MTEQKFREKVKTFRGISGWVALVRSPEGSGAVVGAESEDAAVSLLLKSMEINHGG